MRILLVAHGFPRSPDDMAGSFLLPLAHGQQALGHSVAVVVPHAAGLPMKEELAGVTVYRYRYGSDADETLAYAGTMHEQALRSWTARWRLLQLVQASRREVRRVSDAWRPDVLHVRVVAPFEMRVARLRGERNVSEESARACLEASDRARARYLRRSHGVRLDDPALYHLTINTGLLDLPQAVDLVVRLPRPLGLRIK